MNDKTPQFLSTAAAANMLGLSTTLIQSLVDKNELQGWKTRGGHRRISLQSIHDYQAQARMHSSPPGRSRTLPKILVAVESPAYYLMLQLLETLGLKALEIPTDPRTGVSVEALDLATRDGRVAACLLVPLSVAAVMSGAAKAVAAAGTVVSMVTASTGLGALTALPTCTA